MGTPQTLEPETQTMSLLAPVRAILKPLASLRLTVVLFVLSMILVFCGTLAQMDAGIWSVVAKYFRSAYVWIPWQMFANFGMIFFWVPADTKIPGYFLFPGGWTIGALLLANLLAAHAVRFKLSWKRSGILIIHAGLIILMLGELVTGLYQVEGRMQIETGSSANHIWHPTSAEMALIKTDGKTDDVVVVPADLLIKAGGTDKKKAETIRNDLLPVDVEVKKYMINSALRKLRDGEKSPVTTGIGTTHAAVEMEEGKGVDSTQRIDVPAAYVTLKDKKNGAELGTYLLSCEREEQKLTIDGVPYEITLRFKRTYTPYEMHLLEFRHDVWPGTNKPKDFSSQVRLVDPTKGIDRQVRIFMNNPMRYEGETFYQADFLPGDQGSVLQVVRNPGWTMPYISCTLITLGMILHFGLNLAGFLQRRMA